MNEQGRSERKDACGSKNRLLEELARYGGGDFYPYHMPGHKRNPLAFDGAGEPGGGILKELAKIDITEIPGFDDLHAPEGLLLDGMKRAARLYGSDRAYYSVNGSTAAILTAISAAVPRGGTLIMARNCHRSVYHGVYLRQIRPVYVYPKTVKGTGIADVVTAQQIEEALLLHPEAAAVLIVSPTYDGVTADTAAIAQTVHRYGKPLLVDSAHGAHFGFHPLFPDSAVHQGADLTVMSLHKTLPCMTQTALLHGCGDRVDWDRVALFGRIYQSSSPSYVLMASIDACMQIMENQGRALWDDFARSYTGFLERIRKLQRLRRIPSDAACRMDPGKILIDGAHAGLSGKQLAEILAAKYHLQMEMAVGSYVTAIMTCCDTGEGWDRLASALEQIDKEYRPKTEAAFWGPPVWEESPPVLESACSIGEALDGVSRRVRLDCASGEISATFVNLYPPGIPIVVPGERLQKDVLDLIDALCRRGLCPQGICQDQIAVLCRERRKDEKN